MGTNSRGDLPKMPVLIIDAEVHISKIDSTKLSKFIKAEIMNRRQTDVTKDK